MSDLSPAFLAYSDSIEQKRDDEDQTFALLNELVRRTQVVLNDRYRHAVRFVHSKSHGLLKADLAIGADLAPELRQGLFAIATTYPAIIRFSTAPGDIMADSVSTPRGMAVKVVGLEAAQMVAGHEGQRTQDFVMLNSKVFGAPDAKAFLATLKIIEKNLNDPELVKKAVSNVARGANALLGLFGAHSGGLEQLGAPETDLLGETYGSCAAIRYGDYIAKIAFTPLSDNLKALHGKHVAVNFHYSGLRDAVVEFFKTQTAVWEVGVQLCVDPQKTPVEDPTKPWPEDLSAYRAVGTLTAKPQDAYSPARRVYCDDVLAFNPWHALAAHRPLGNIMRARRAVYIASAGYRQSMNGNKASEPRNIADLPD